MVRGTIGLDSKRDPGLSDGPVRNSDGPDLLRVTVVRS